LLIFQSNCMYVIFSPTHLSVLFRKESFFLWGFSIFFPPYLLCDILDSFFRGPLPERFPFLFLEDFRTSPFPASLPPPFLHPSHSGPLCSSFPYRQRGPLYFGGFTRRTGIYLSYGLCSLLSYSFRRFTKQNSPP